jgi:hypothetical protein
MRRIRQSQRTSSHLHFDEDWTWFGTDTGEGDDEIEAALLWLGWLDRIGSGRAK